MYRKIRKKIYQVLEPTVYSGLSDKVFEYFIMTLVVLNVLAVALETDSWFCSQFEKELYVFEVFSVGIFTVEYLLRIWACVEDERFKRPVLGRLRFILTPMALVDLIAILPFYLFAFNMTTRLVKDTRVVRILRLFRIFRLVKLGRYSESLKTFARVFKAKKEEMIVIVFIVFISLFVSSSLMYVVENGAQPDKFSSIFAAMWWGVATLTTVGYGDVFPVTILGKILGSIIALLGIGTFALPAGILASAFAEEIKKEKNCNLICPHCGKAIDSEDHEET